MMEYNMAGGPLLPPQEEDTISSALMAPTAYEPVYSQEHMRNPRREFWGNMLIDMGNMFGSWNGNQFTRPMTGAGFKARAQAQSANERMMAANRTAQRQYQQDYNRYQQAVPQLAATNLALEQKQSAHGMGLNPNTPESYQKYILAQQSGFQGSYNDFLQQQARLGIGDRRTANRKDWEYMMSLPPDQRAMFLNHFVDAPGGRASRAGVDVRPDGQGGFEVFVPSIGDYVPADESMMAMAQQEVGTGKGRVERFNQSQVAAGEVDDQFQTEMQTHIPKVQDSYDGLLELRSAIESGQYDDKMGFLQGRYKGYTDRDAAQLAAKSVLQALNNLQIVNLAPVTEKEIAMVKQMGLDIVRDPQANLGALDEMINRLEKVLRSAGEQQDYFDAHGSLEGYGRSVLRDEFRSRPPAAAAGGGRSAAANRGRGSAATGGNITIDPAGTTFIPSN
jgi:hypothetical protein